MSLLDGKLVDSHVFAFGLPAGFRRQVARHATSWETYHYFDATRDVSLQLFARAPLTPAYRSRSHTYRRHIEGQFISWSCPTARLEELQSILSGLGLRFAYIQDLSDEDIKRGAICEVTFDPSIGIFPMALDWDSFDRGSVRATLEEAGVFAKLPGDGGAAEASKAILSMYPGVGEPPDFEMVSERDAQHSLPLDADGRVLQVERFHYMPGIDERISKERLAEFRSELESAVRPGYIVSLDFEVFEGIDGTIGRAEASCAASTTSAGQRQLFLPAKG